MGAASGKTLRRWARRALILGASVLVVGAVVYRALDRPAWIDSYRPIDDRTLVLVAVTGPSPWAHVTELTETATTVTVTINIFEVGLGGTAAGYPTLVLVHLRDPIAGRTVVNGDTGQAIDRRLCPAPPEPDTAFGCP